MSADLAVRGPFRGTPVDSEALAYGVPQASLNGIYIYDLASRLLVFINERYTHLTGYTLPELQAMDPDRFLELFHPDDREGVLRHSRQVAESGEQGLEIEYRFLTKAGRWIWCLSRDSVLTRAADGTPTRIIGSFLDLSDRKRSEQALIKSERIYRELATNLPSGAAFIIDTQFRYLLAAGSALADTGMRPEDLEGKTVKEALGEELAVQYESRLRNAFNGIPFKLEHFSHGRHYNSHGVPLKDAEGQIYAALVVSYDISERKEAEENRRRAMETSRALNRLHTALHSTLSFDEVIRRVLAGGSKLLGCDSAAVSMREASDWVVRHVHDMPSDLVGMRIPDAQERHAVLAFESRRIVAVDDAYNDPRLDNDHMRRHNIRSVIVAPLVVRDEAIGAIFFNYHKAPHTFADTEIDFVRQMTHIAGMALSNARLYEAQKAAEDQVRQINRSLEQIVAERTAEIERQYKHLEGLNARIKELSRKTIAAMENDRKALSKEIHDSIGGSLSAIKMMLEYHWQGVEAHSEEKYQEIIGHLAETIKETKRISFQLRSLVLDEFGLLVAIEENIKRFKSFYPDITVHLVTDIAPETLSEEIVTVIYRVVQEALNNAGKHSRADTIRVALNEDSQRIFLEIEDNGRGFEVESTLHASDTIQGLGLHGMKERVEICKGDFSIRSAPGAGTTLRASIPK